MINEIVHGLQYQSVSKFSDDLPSLVCDMSSKILSREFDVNDYGLIYTDAQKNIDPAGVIVVITREDLLERCPKDIPSVLNYQSRIKCNGMHNMPATYLTYMAGPVFHWLLTQGGVKKIESVNNLKAETFYRVIDDSGGFYINNIQAGARSEMSVIFKTSDPDLDDTFAREAEPRGLCALKGCKLLSGIRASICNAAPLEDMGALAAFIQDFRRCHDWITGGPSEDKDKGFSDGLISDQSKRPVLNLCYNPFLHISIKDMPTDAPHLLTTCRFSKSLTASTSNAK